MSTGPPRRVARCSARRRHRRLLTAALAASLGLATFTLAEPASAATPQTFVEHTSTWKVLDNGTNQTPAALPSTTHFAAPAYDDTAWTSHTIEANKVLGYGDNARVSFPTQTPNLFSPPQPNRYITTYFRQSFEVTDASLVQTPLNLSIRRDDGAVVYLNGVEVYRTNMPAGAINFTTFSSSIIDGAGEYTPVTTTIDPANLVTGTNVIAVELHQRDGNSSDITFAMTLDGMVEEPPPVVVPEAPVVVLMGLGAAAVLGGAVAVSRRRDALTI